MDLKSNWTVIWVLAKREIMGYFRFKSRVISSIAQSVLFLLVFSGGFFMIDINIQGMDISSTAFSASGIAAMTILFSGIFGGMGVMRDKMFGFMKELLVAPVNRTTLMVGRTLGLSLQTVIQCMIILGLSIAFGFFGYDISLIWRVILVIPAALFISIGIIGMGLTIASKLKDFQAFGLIQTFIVMPMFMLSGALFAFNNIPFVMQIVTMINPFAYGVDLFRYLLLGVSYFPLWLNLLVLLGFGSALILTGARSFSKMQDI